MAESDRYVFIIEWYDTRSTLYKEFQLVYFPSNDELLIVSLPFLGPTLIVRPKEEKAIP